jgi:flagellar hook-associated protein 2
MTTTSNTAVNVSGTTTYLTGTASGIDTASLIAAAVAQKTQRADTLDAKVTTNTTKIASYQQLQSLIDGLSTSMGKLAASNNGLDTTTNAFADKAITLTVSDSSTAADYLAISASPDAAVASYTVTVGQLATAQKIASTAQSATDALGLAGTFTLTAGAGAAQSIAVTTGMTLSDIASAINAAAPASGVSASVIKTGDGQARLVLSANDTNAPIATTAAGGDDLLASLGVTQAGGGFTNIIQAAQPAVVTIDGNRVTSDTNELTDAVTGLSLSLLKSTPAGATLTLDVKPDFGEVKTAITDFATAYNALRTFVAANQAVGADGTAASSAVLFADSLLRGASQMLNQIIGGDAASATGSISNLAELGMTLDASNNLVLSNEDALDTALLTSLGSVASMFQSSFTTSDPALKMLRNTSTTAYHFTLDVVGNADGSVASVSVGGDASLFTVSGNRIVGAAGGPYDGLSFALVTHGASSIDVDIRPGFANQITAFASLYGDTSSGMIQNQIAALNDQDSDYSTQSDKIRSDADTYKTQLVSKYSKMEQEVSAAQLAQQQIKAILNASSSND